MSRVLLVAWREFLATAMTPVFIITSVVVPLGCMALFAFVMPVLINPEPKPLVGKLAVLDPGRTLAEGIKAELTPERLEERVEQRRENLKRAGVGSFAGDETVAKAMGWMTDVQLEVEVITDPAALEGLLARLRSGQLVAIVSTVQPQAEKKPKQPEARQLLYLPRDSSSKHTSFLNEIVALADERVRVQEAGLDVKLVRELSSTLKPKNIRLTRDGLPEEEAKGAKIAKEIVPFAFLMLLWMSAFVGGNYLLTTTIEEKSNKVMEVLLSAVSPLQLMAGKIVGQGLVGLVMLAAYGTVGFLALFALAFLDLIEWSHLVYLAVYFVMAYFMIAAMMAGIGSAVSDLREAQSLLTPVMLIVMIPLFLQVPILEAPNGTLAVVSSFIPPATPFVMVLRLTAAGAEVPGWQVVASLVWGFACTIAMVWMAAKIFRVGVLMQGKPPSPLELLKWLRYE